MYTRKQWNFNWIFLENPIFTRPSNLWYHHEQRSVIHPNSFVWFLLVLARLSQIATLHNPHLAGNPDASRQRSDWRHKQTRACYYLYGKGLKKKNKCEANGNLTNGEPGIWSMKWTLWQLEGGRLSAPMVSNKVPATADCLSDGIHKAKERTKEEDGGRRRRQRVVGRGRLEHNSVENTRRRWKVGGNQHLLW